MNKLDYAWMVPTLVVCTVIGCLIVLIMGFFDLIKHSTWLLALLWFMFVFCIGAGLPEPTYIVGFLLLATAIAQLKETKR